MLSGAKLLDVTDCVGASQGKRRIYAVWRGVGAAVHNAGLFMG
jgi:hypothetical protein